MGGRKKVFIINCQGCKEVHFPEKEAAEFQKELADDGNVTGIITDCNICNPENMKLRLQKHMSAIEVCRCGVGILLRRRCTDNCRVPGG